jgi:hypothetical protein
VHLLSPLPLHLHLPFLLVIPEGDLLFARRAASPQKPCRPPTTIATHFTINKPPKTTSYSPFPQQKQGSTTSEFSGQIPTNATIEKAA